MLVSPRWPHALAVVTLLAAAPALAAATTTPNVVFIQSDDHGYADVGFRGSVIDTPHIDALAAAGVALERYHTYPICGPTRVGLMTGRNPITVGVTANISAGEDGVPLDEHFLPESFRAANYQTWMMGKWHLGGTTSTAYLPQSRGFDHFYGFVGGSIHETTHKTSGTGLLDWQRNGVPVPEDDGLLSTDLMATEAVSLILARDEARPFFLYLSFHALHTPYDAPTALKVKYLNLGLTGPALQYAAMAENMDLNIGRVLDVLKSEGIEDETIVVFASDNGAAEAGGGSNLPLRGWKNEVFEGGHRTPAVVRWPGHLPAGTTSDQFVSHIDWLPTLASAAGVPTQNVKPLDGVDRWAALGAGESGRPKGFTIRRGQGRVVFDGDWKLLRVANVAPWQLFDVYSDPNESTDVAASHQDVVAALAAHLPSCDGAVTLFGEGCAAQGGAVPALDLLGCPDAGNPVLLEITDAPPSSLALLLFGLSEASVPAAGDCTLLVGQLLPLQLAVPLTASGSTSIPLTIPTLAAPVTTTLQAFVADPASPWGYADTNGLTVVAAP